MLKPRFFILLFPLLLCSAAPAFARQWVLVGSGAESNTYIDVDSIKGTGDTRTFWQRTIFEGDQIDHFPYYRSTLHRTFVNCRSEQIGILQAVRYNAKGAVVDESGSSTNTEPIGLDAVLPDSMGELTLRYVCRLRTRASDRRLTQDSLPQPPLPSALTQAQAVGLVTRWLNAKRKIFAPPYDRQLAADLTTGKLYSDLSKSGGSIDWLQQNTAYYRYGIQKIGKVQSFSAGKTSAVLKVEVTEDSTLYKAGKVVSNSTGTTTATLKYELMLIQNTWKIKDYQKL